MSCDTCPREKTHQLFEGGMACSYCEEYRHECEARHVVNMRSLTARQRHLASVERVRGEPAAKRLKKTVWRMWHERKNAA